MRSSRSSSPFNGPGRPARRRARLGIAAVSALLYLTLGAGTARAMSVAEMEEIYAAAALSRDGAVVRAAAETLVEAREGFQAPGLLWTRIGLLYLKLQDQPPARMAFEKAIKADSTLASARYGLGRVYLELRSDPAAAARNLIRAIRIDSTYSEAYYALGQAFLEMDDPRAVKAANDALRHDPNFAPAYLLMAQWSLRHKAQDEAIANYRRFLQLEPEDISAAFDFALKLLDLKMYAEVYDLASVMRDVNGLPLRAQVRLALGDYEEALDLYTRYIDLLSEPEARLYHDISLVGKPDEVAAYNATPSEDREAFLRKFWFKHDPFKTSGGAMRRAEHYRRVWYARSHFSESKQPWDRRGEVYIRFGEPDWKSAWNDVNARIPLKVQRIQERLAFQLYGREAVGMTFYGPVYPIRTRRTIDNPVEDKYSPFETTTQPISTFNEREVGLAYYRPVSAGSDQSAVGWEVWVYTSLGDGMEIAFTDELYSGAYDYAPQPTVSSDDIGEVMSTFQGKYRNMVERLPTLSPEVQVAWVTKKLPERYDVAEFEPMEFYYDAVTFRGESGKADVQMNIGLPLESVYMKGDPDTTVVVERRISLTDTVSAEGSKRRDTFGVRVSKQVVGKNLVAVDRVNVAADPGGYVLALQMSRKNTTRLQAYHQAVDVPDYWGEDLMLSDLQLAQRIQEAGPAGQDPRFIRGGFYIVPSPARAFRAGDPLYLYFEVYNLTRDNFGQTRYEVTFEIHGRGKDRPAAFATRVKKRSGETVAIQYEQVGRSSIQKDYVELDLAGAKPGNYTVQMAVRDLNASTSVLRTADFRIIK